MVLPCKISWFFATQVTRTFLQYVCVVSHCLLAGQCHLMISCFIAPMGAPFGKGCWEDTEHIVWVQAQRHLEPVLTEYTGETRGNWLCLQTAFFPKLFVKDAFKMSWDTPAVNIANTNDLCHWENVQKLYEKHTFHCNSLSDRVSLSWRRCSSWGVACVSSTSTLTPATQ